jgi:hypothetical protein
MQNGTIPDTRPGANSTPGVNCTNFMNTTFETLDGNFTELMTNFTTARAPVALKAGNQTVNASSNPNFVNASLFDAAKIDTLTKTIKPLNKFLLDYKERLVTDKEIGEKSWDLE